MIFEISQNFARRVLEKVVTFYMNLSIKNNQRISLIRAKMECLLASPSYREVVERVRLSISCPRSYEAIRQSVTKEVKLIIEDQEKRLHSFLGYNNPEEYEK